MKVDAVFMISVLLACLVVNAAENARQKKKIKAKVVDAQEHDGTMPFIIWNSPEKPSDCLTRDEVQEKLSNTKKRIYEARIPNIIVGGDTKKYCEKCVEIIYRNKKAYAKIIGTFVDDKSSKIKVSSDVFLRLADPSKTVPLVKWKIVECQDEMFDENSEFE
jgi:hypothetical protein